MPLGDYEKKREFDQTPEPGADANARPPGFTGPVFCIQRHDARRLHFDLRMEIGGTLKSWAVPEGPTQDPTIKRLAVMVEDHPMMYATFEGNIPKGNYGAGSMMLWDLGEFEVLDGKTPEAQLERGDFKFRLRGQKLRGDFALVRLKNSAKGNEWLLLKKKDAAAVPGWSTAPFDWSVASGRTQDEIAHDMPPRSRGTPAKMPKKIVPMLAQIGTEVPRGPDWMWELKWDGVRAVLFFADGKIRIDSRKSTPIERQYPELQAIQLHAESAIVDGEIAALDEQGRPRFNRIQPRIMATDSSAIAQLAKSNPVVYFAFDLLYLNGRDLRSMPLRDRRRLLATVVEPSPVLRISEELDGDPEQILQVVRAQEMEGLVGKNLNSVYEPSRSRHWQKLKTHREQEFVLCGYTEGQRDYFGALICGAYDGKRLVWVGNVGTGFDQKTMKMLRAQMDPLVTDKRPFADKPAFPEKPTWIRPSLVCTVRYFEWTEDKRLRGPVYVGLRPDIDPSECTLEPEEMQAPPVRVARPPLLPPKIEEVTSTIDGHRLKFTSLNKVYYPADGVMKRDVLNYYDAVADLLLPHWKDRPLSLRRYPEGIEHEGFFQKNAAEGFPDWVRRHVVMAENDEPRMQAIGNGRAELLFLTQLGCIDQNPWMSRVETLDHPDFLLIDLDPFECPYDKIVEAAHVVRRKLDLLGLTGYPKTTGGNGLHIYVPLEPIYSYHQTKAVAEVLARVCAAERPDLFTLPRNVKGREKGRVYFDFLQNGRGKTISAPYVLRPRPGATVATPLDWREVKAGLKPSDFHIRNALERFARVGDLFSGVLTNRQRLEPVIERLDALVRGAQG